MPTGAEDLVSERAQRNVWHFLRKPIQAQEILSILSDLLSAVRESRPQPMPGTSLRAARQSTLLTVRGLLRLVGMRDLYTLGHSLRVRRMAGNLARVMGMQDDRVRTICTAGWVHDVGKICVPLEILAKPGLLLPHELTEIRAHASVGAAILESLGMPAAVVLAVRHHHERWDGVTDGRYPGYPDGLAGMAIPVEARVLTVVDVFDAMVTNRVYRQGLPVTSTLNEMERQAGTQFDPGIVRVFLDLMRSRLTQ